MLSGHTSEKSDHGFGDWSREWFGFFGHDDSLVVWVHWVFLYIGIQLSGSPACCLCCLFIYEKPRALDLQILWHQAKTKLSSNSNRLVKQNLALYGATELNLLEAKRLPERLLSFGLRQQSRQTFQKLKLPQSLGKIGVILISPCFETIYPPKGNS